MHTCFLPHFTFGVLASSQYDTTNAHTPTAPLLLYEAHGSAGRRLLNKATKKYTTQEGKSVAKNSDSTKESFYATLLFNNKLTKNQRRRFSSPWPNSGGGRDKIVSNLARNVIFISLKFARRISSFRNAIIIYENLSAGECV